MDKETFDKGLTLVINPRTISIYWDINDFRFYLRFAEKEFVNETPTYERYKEAKYFNMWMEAAGYNDTQMLLCMSTAFPQRLLLSVV